MPKYLVIVESPAKAKTINKFLGSDYHVTSSYGHCIDLPKSKLGVDVEHDFKPDYIVIPERKKNLEGLKKEAKGKLAIYLCPDPDREGEAISWHLKNALSEDKPKGKSKAKDAHKDDRKEHHHDRKFYRVTFDEITKDAVLTAFKHPREIDTHLVNAQQARRILDRIVGYTLSPLLWKKVSRGLSAGRVQSVAVRLIVEREHEIKKFKPEEYWDIEAELKRKADEPKEKFRAKLVKHGGKDIEIHHKEAADRIVAALKKEHFVVGDIRETKKKKNPVPPFTTSKLQQEAARKLHFSAKKTMMVAQQLYEGVEVGAEGSLGLITYMRTDSFRIADEALGECRALIARRFGDKYLSAQPRHFRARRGAQEAHEAIRPTDVGRTPESLEPHLTPDQLRLYRLIWERFVACQMADAEYDVTKVAVAAGPATFQATGRVLLFDGHTRAYPPLKRSDEEEQPLPPLAAGMALRCLDLVPSQHFTKPPPRYTEASLVKTLEREGIGRPSTYAQIISTIQDRGYVEVRDKVFFAKELGIVTNDALLPFFENIINTRFTSQVEEDLDGIEEGKSDWRAVLTEFYTPFQADLAKAEADMPSVKKALAAATDEVCDKCGSPMVIRLSKNGRFLACSAFPKCRNTRALDENGEATREEAIDEKCPQCGEPLSVRTGRRGKFVGCSAYPKCRYTRPAEGGAPAAGATPAAPKAPAEPTGEACPKCGKPLLTRVGGRGKFVGCSGFPRCRFTRPLEGEAAPETPPAATTDVKCEKCGSPMVVRTGRRGRFLACSAYPKCKSTKPVREAGPVEPPKEVGRVCPECGKPLVLRASARGPFIGCSGYPKCRHTENAGGETLPGEGQ